MNMPVLYLFNKYFSLNEETEIIQATQFLIQSFTDRTTGIKESFIGFLPKI